MGRLKKTLNKLFGKRITVIVERNIGARIINRHDGYRIIEVNRGCIDGVRVLNGKVEVLEEEENEQKTK